MKMLTTIKRLIGVMVLLLTPNICYADSVEQVESWSNQSLELNLNYPENVEIRTWDNNEIRLTANVELVHSDGSDVSAAFNWLVDRNNNEIKITADFGKKIANTVLMKSGVDIPGGIHGGFEIPGITGDAMVSGTQMVIYVPRNCRLTVNSTTGKIEVQHPGSDLFIDSIGDVMVVIDTGDAITVSASSMMGEIDLTSEQIITRKAESNSKNKLTLSSKRKMFHLNGGGAETSIVTVAGDIQFHSASPLEVEAIQY